MVKYISSSSRQNSNNNLSSRKKVGLSQVIKQIAQQVANANHGTNATHVYQVLVQLAKQTEAQTYNKEQAIEEIRQISSQVARYASSTISQSLVHFTQQLTYSALVLL